MTWTLNFEVKDNKIDPESIHIGGTLPAGVVSVYGYQNQHSRSVTINIGGLSAAVGVSTPSMPAD